MKILENKIVEECLDGIVRKELRFSPSMSEKLIRLLGRLGKLEYYPHFHKPLYKITRKGEFILKGIQGHDTCQVVFIDYSNELELFLHDFFMSLNEHDPSPPR